MPIRTRFKQALLLSCIGCVVALIAVPMFSFSKGVEGTSFCRLGDRVIYIFFLPSLLLHRHPLLVTVFSLELLFGYYSLCIVIGILWVSLFFGYRYSLCIILWVTWASLFFVYYSLGNVGIVILCVIFFG